MTEQKMYISGHNIRRFFHVSEAELSEVRRKHKDKYVDNGFYKWYELGFLKMMFPVRCGVPEHLIKAI